MARVLAISAHPDDELFGAGYLAKLAAEGNEVYLLCTTRGEGGEVGDPSLGPKERLGEIRVGEQRCAAAALGARDVWFLPFVDPHMEIDGVASRIDATLDELAAAIAEHFERLRPDVVITHGSDGEYGHPQHVFTHQAVRAAIRRLAPWQPSELLTWCANTGQNTEDRQTNKNDRADFSLDVTPWFDRKVAAAECHVTQHAMFRRNSSKQELRDILRRHEAYKRWPLNGSG